MDAVATVLNPPNESVAFNNDNDHKSIDEDTGQNVPIPNSMTIPFTKDQLIETQLLKCLNDANAPHFLYKSIVDWANNAYCQGYKFDSTRTTRAAQINNLENWYKLKYLRPMQIPTVLPFGGEIVQVTAFDFANQLYSLLRDPGLVGNLDKLDVNPTDPFGKYISPTGLLSTVNSGKIYQDAYDHLVKDPAKDVRIPITMACVRKTCVR
jgi:hypothetical protein